ncbi:MULTISPECIES: hypothetical protein [Deinococcus]|uniref:hypothetical protein n=1 Tax=Deinococcus TaxID=1298 RepID=UPI00059BD443|nr:MULTISPECIES: hypothetical protein [Deinococcus]TDE84998.1 hypothetical protein E0686_14250 [Deinococcus sp. S9]
MKVIAPLFCALLSLASAARGQEPPITGMGNDTVIIHPHPSPSPRGVPRMELDGNDTIGVLP